MIRTYFIIGLVVALVSTAMLAMYQTDRVRQMQDENRGLKFDIRNLKIAMALTDQLRKDNANVDKDAEDIRNDLRDAQGYGDPLSADVVRILDRVLSTGSTP